MDHPLIFQIIKVLFLYFADMFTKYTQFVIRVQKLLKGDSIIVMLLIVITLFSADRTVVEQKEKVNTVAMPRFLGRWGGEGALNDHFKNFSPNRIHSWPRGW